MARLILTTTSLLALTFYSSLWAVDRLVSCLNDPQVTAAAGGAVFAYTTLLTGAFFLCVLLLQLMVARGVEAEGLLGKVAALSIAAIVGAVYTTDVLVQQI